MVVLPPSLQRPVATVPTVYGIETYPIGYVSYDYKQLQQYLPFTRLKQTVGNVEGNPLKLQQYLPFTVLKRDVCRVLYFVFYSCNSTYRLRY